MSKLGAVYKAARRAVVLMAGGAMVFQAAGCQTTGAELLGGLASAVLTNAVNSFVFGAFGLP